MTFPSNSQAASKLKPWPRLVLSCAPPPIGRLRRCQKRPVAAHRLMAWDAINLTATYLRRQKEVTGFCATLRNHSRSQLGDIKLYNTPLSRRTITHFPEEFIKTQPRFISQQHLAWWFKLLPSLPELVQGSKKSGYRHLNRQTKTSIAVVLNSFSALLWPWSISFDPSKVCCQESTGKPDGKRCRGVLGILSEDCCGVFLTLHFKVLKCDHDYLTSFLTFPSAN